MKTLGRLGFATFILFLLAATAVWAQEPPPPEDQSVDNQSANQADPPGRAARLQYTTGSVSIQPEGNGDWVEGSVNRPLTNNDNVWTDKDSRAEVNAGTGILRMDSESSLTITNITENAVQVQLHQGALSLEVRRLYDGEVYEVDTPNMAFTVQKPGEYRFDVDPNGDTSRIVVWKGEGDATGEGPAVHLREHQSARFSNGTSLTHEIAEAPGYDGFDDWGHIRDRRNEGSVSARHVAPGVVGYEDLDEYGSWRNDSTYGDVWYPSGVAADWAPYRYGHWVWVGPWGWTWVDDAPWGFAPFHYGRWVYAGGYWGWAPGPIYARPYYAPALVAWFGGPGWGVGLGFGGGFGYGWCPLGWNEPFIPWYHHSFGYYRNVNFTNIHVRDFGRFNRYYGGRESFRGYSNLRYPGGRTAVSRETIIGARPVGRSMVRVSSNEFSRAPLGGRVGLTPTRASRLGVNAGRAASVPPQRAFSRPVVSRMSTPSRNGGFNRGFGNNNERNIGSMGRNDNANRGFGNMNRNVPRPGNNSSFGQRTEANSNLRMNQNGDRGSFSNRNGSSANIPRPGNNGRMEANSNIRTNSNADRGSFSNRGSANVPRPPASFGGRSSEGNARVNDSGRGSFGGRSGSNMPAERSAPRSSEGNGNRGGDRGSQNSRPQGHSMNYVPRPSGPVRPAGNYSASTRSYGGEQAYRGYSSNSRESYGSNSRSYGSAERAYGSPNYGSRNYGSSSSRSPYAGSYGNSGRSSYPQYSARSGGGYSAPSYRSAGPSYRSSAPSYHASAPSYRGGGGGGGGSYRGGSSGGGGFHGGGGGGGHTSGGGGHGHR